MIQRSLLIVLSVATLLLISKCNSIEPPVNGNGQDTTSHNFSWQTWTWGEHSSSLLYDVAIISKNNIWAVGEIYLNDSLGQPDPHAYNAAHWDGEKWELKRIKYYGNCSAVEYPPLKAVWVFSDNSIVVTNGGSIGWFDGSTLLLDCEINPLLAGAVNKIWGPNKDDLYICGNNGSVAHYQNGDWSIIESGTSLDVYDIWGNFNETRREYEIVAVAAKQFVTYDKKILRIYGNTVEDINSDSIPYSIHGLWFESSKKYFVSGAGLYSKSNINYTSKWEWLHPDVTNYYLYAVRGQKINDLVACGAFGEIVHFNGSTWKSFINVTNISNGAYINIDFKEDIAVAVGYDNPKAIINVGTR